MRRLSRRSLRVRLTFWYSSALILAALVMVGASRWALAVSLNHALDQGLRYRLMGLHGFIDENSGGGMDQLGVKLRALNHLGELFQVFGPRGELMSQSDGLARHRVSTQPPPDSRERMSFRNGGPPWFPMRMAAERIDIAGQTVTIEVADPQRKFEGVMHDFHFALSIVLPLVLAASVFGGYWLSGRALRPVDLIIDEAHRIHPSNLAARLSVPASGDELQRLSETLNQMLSRVEQSVLRVRQFTADASHELRAPLTLISSAAQFLLRRERCPNEREESVRRILRETERCTALIDQLLWLARLDAGNARMDWQRTDISALVSGFVNDVIVLAAAKGLNVSVSAPDSPVQVALDEASFRRMLLILLDNAIKYTPDGGSVSIRVLEDASEVKIAVADTGLGIAPADLPLVFDRFWRADKVRSRDAGGTGLGLAIAREIAERHHGSLTVESAVGIGSVFTISLSRDPSEGISPARLAEQSV